MNPLSLIMIGLGLILIYVGWKGSQHTVVASLLGHPSNATAAGTTDVSPNGQPNTPAASNSGTATNLSTQRNNIGSAPTSTGA
jgi:hypothetical protein